MKRMNAREIQVLLNQYGGDLVYILELHQKLQAVADAAKSIYIDDNVENDEALSAALKALEE